MAAEPRAVLSFFRFVSCTWMRLLLEMTRVGLIMQAACSATNPFITYCQRLIKGHDIKLQIEQSRHAVQGVKLQLVSTPADLL